MGIDGRGRYIWAALVAQPRLAAHCRNQYTETHVPELPEVETYIRELAPQLKGRQIQSAQVYWPRTVAEPAPQEFTQAIRELYFVDFQRRGKYMLLGLAPQPVSAPTPGGTPTPGAASTAALPWTLIVHLRMTGKLQLVDSDFERTKHTHVVFNLHPHMPDSASDSESDSESKAGRNKLVFIDTRKFGRMWLTPAPEAVLCKLGPEPLSREFSPATLGTKLTGRQAAIKALLLDQSIVAGVGNIYADEALFRAGIHPQQPGGSITAPQLERLHMAVCRVLQAGIDAQGSSLGGSALQNYVRPLGETGGFQEEHRVFRRTGQPCFVCQTPITRIIVAQRSTHFCPSCQPLCT